VPAIKLVPRSGWRSYAMAFLGLGFLVGVGIGLTAWGADQWRSAVGLGFLTMFAGLVVGAIIDRDKYYLDQKEEALRQDGATIDPDKYYLDQEEKVLPEDEK